jgi:hypothetical protein
VSSSRYIISNKPLGQPSAFILLSSLHAITCTLGTVLHMLSFRQRQWFVLLVLGPSICPRQLAQVSMQLSIISFKSGGACLEF